MRLRFRFWRACRRNLLPTRLLRTSKDSIEMMNKVWRDEWILESFTLKYDTPEHFTRCHWQTSERVHPLWLTYRAFAALYFIFSLMFCVLPIGRHLPEESRSKYLIFLTHWSYVAESFQVILALIIVCIRTAQEVKNSPLPPMVKMPWYYKLYWIFYTITISSALIVSVTFWKAVYDPELFPVNATNLIEHAMNSIFVILDFWLVGHPVKFLHFYFPAMFGILYAAFSLIYQLSGGTGVKGLIPIYKILDWREPFKAAMTCILTLACLLFVHFLYACLTLGKIACKAKKSSKQNTEA